LFEKKNEEDKKMNNDEDHPILRYWQQRISRTITSTKDPDSPPPPVRIFELGAGIGVLGINLAAAGAGASLVDGFEHLGERTCHHVSQSRLESSTKTIIG
jgi:hypothetical protein